MPGQCVSAAPSSASLVGTAALAAAPWAAFGHARAPPPPEAARLASAKACRPCSSAARLTPVDVSTSMLTTPSRETCRAGGAVQHYGRGSRGPARGPGAKAVGEPVSHAGGVEHVAWRPAGSSPVRAAPLPCGCCRARRRRRAAEDRGGRRGRGMGGVATCRAPSWCASPCPVCRASPP